MKNFILQFLVVTGSVIILFASCQQDTGKKKLLGKWKINELHIEYYAQQKKLGDMQVQMLKDSLAATTDTVKIKQYTSQIRTMEDQLNAFTASRDSAIKKNSWEFKEAGEFIATESEGAKKGIWSYDPELKMLFTVIDNQASSVKVDFRNDTLLLELDSVNYMKFVPANN